MRYNLYGDGQFVSRGEFIPDAAEEENRLIKLYPQFADQTWDAFGGAVTDSAGYVFSKMGERERDLLLDAYFGDGGLHYDMIRVPIDSCDFSLEQYEAAADGESVHFNMDRPLRYILPLLEDVRARKQNIRLMLSPWSPPKRFKSNGQRHGGGKCMPQYYDAWAECICQYILEFKQRGFIVSCISLQNEPHAVQTWDSCIWSAEEERTFLTDSMKPALIRHGFSDVQVYIWDHNKERILDRA